MTAKQAKQTYGIKTEENGHKVGYVYCQKCPINHADKSYCPECCSGLKDTWKAIAKYMTTKGSENDPVSHPSHYTQGGIECIDAMVSAFGKEAVANFCMCNAFKYIWRSKHKNGNEDIEKAKWYLNKHKELTASE